MRKLPMACWRCTGTAWRGADERQIARAKAGVLPKPRLFPLAVEVQPEVEVLRIADLVCRDEPGAAGREGRVALSFRPLPFPLELVLAFRDVVQDAVAGDVAGRFLLRDVPKPLADDDLQPDPPLQPWPTPGPDGPTHP